jgi:outer membrane protein OmpA-like peptidoglycan-associated protein
MKTNSPRLFPSVLAAMACAVTAFAGVPAAHAQDTRLAPQQARISDPVIQADYDGYLALQERIKKLNDGGRRVADYHLSKAQCWLDVSFHEYTRNDRGPFPQAALTESEKLVVAMERGVAPLPDDTPLVGEAVLLRPDLWERARALRGEGGFECAAQKTACAEVELVHAGNERAQQQWRHAKPYVQKAEDLLAQASEEATSCRDAAARAAVVPAVVPATAAAHQLWIGAEVVFAFDKSGVADIRPASRAQLEALAERLKRDNLAVESIELVGHADRLNSTGNAAYNQALSEKRVATVRDELVRLGVDPARISTSARGDGIPVVDCSGRGLSQAALRECLLPNRRVDVQVRATPR